MKDIIYKSMFNRINRLMKGVWIIYWNIELLKFILIIYIIVEN